MNGKFYQEIEDYSPKKQSETLSTICQQWSQETSACSDPDGNYPKEIWFNKGFQIQTPFTAIAVLVAMDYISSWSSYNQRERLEKHIHEMASSYRFQGRWKIVGEIQQIPALRSGINGRMSILCKYYSKNAIFGSLLPLVWKILKFHYITKIPQYRKYRDSEVWKYFEPKPKRKIRRRGYDDKGSRTPDDKWLPGSDWSLEEKELRSLELKNQFKLQEPPSRYWYRSTPYSNAVPDRIDHQLERLKRKEKIREKRRKQRKRRRIKKRKTQLLERFLRALIACQEEQTNQSTERY